MLAAGKGGVLAAGMQAPGAAAARMHGLVVPGDAHIRVWQLGIPWGFPLRAQRQRVQESQGPSSPQLLPSEQLGVSLGHSGVLVEKQVAVSPSASLLLSSQALFPFTQGNTVKSRSLRVPRSHPVLRVLDEPLGPAGCWQILVQSDAG